MREIRSYGSVRGATRESRPYRDPIPGKEAPALAPAELFLGRQGPQI